MIKHYLIKYLPFILVFGLLGAQCNIKDLSTDTSQDFTQVQTFRLSVSGAVVDNDNKAISGAEVSIKISQIISWNKVVTTFSNGQGTYLIYCNASTDASYIIEASKSGYQGESANLSNITAPQVVNFKLRKQ